MRGSRVSFRDKIRDWESLFTLAAFSFYRGGSIVPTLGMAVDPVNQWNMEAFWAVDYVVRDDFVVNLAQRYFIDAARTQHADLRDLGPRRPERGPQRDVAPAHLPVLTLKAAGGPDRLRALGPMLPSPTRHRVAVVLALVGVAVSALTFHVTSQLVSVDGYTSFCNLGSVVNCDTVLSSKWGTMLGLPVSLWAMGAFTAGCAARAPRSDGRDDGRPHRPRCCSDSSPAASASRSSSPSCRGSSSTPPACSASRWTS